jgi:hypothetical protein
MALKEPSEIDFCPSKIDPFEQCSKVGNLSLLWLQGRMM